jgi:hypothetical protein
MKKMNPRFTLRRLEQSSKWLQKLIQNGKFHQLSFKKRQQLISRIERLKLSLSKFGQFQQVRKVVAGSAVILSMALGNTATAQNFSTLQTNPFGLTDGYSVSFPTAGDLDNDGDIDFLIGDASGTIRYFQNTGNASAPVFTPITTNSPTANISGYYFAIPSLADIDNDGDLDLFVTELYGAINFYENIGTPTAPVFSTPQTAFGLNTAALGLIFVDVDFVDMDNDGDFDAIVSGYYAEVRYYENTGTATNAAFTTPIQNPFGMTAITSEYGFAAMTDIDGDGDLDLFLGIYYGDVEYFQNTGTASQAVFGTSVQNPFNIALNPTGNYLASPLFVDIDNDGDLDLFAGSYGTTGAILFQENLAISVPNNAPTSANSGMTINQDAPTGFDASLFPFSDVDTLQNLTKIKIITVPTNGTFNLFGFPVAPNQEITVTDLVGLVYEPTVGQYGTNFDSFSFQVSDGIDYSATAYQFTINVNALPSTIQTTVETYENTDYVFDVADFTFTDPDGGTFQEIQIVTLPNKGQVKLNGTAVTAGDTIAVADFANLTFSPDANETGFPYTDFEFAVGDGTGFSAPATLIVDVNFPINTNTIDGFNTITLSPNPVSEIANIRIETEVKKSATLSVQSIAGQVILNQNIELNGDFNAAINVSDWTKGVYIIRLQTIDGEVWTEKLVVQ